MYEMRFLEQAIEELQSLREENEKLKCKIWVYEEFVKDIGEILNRK